MASGKRRLIVLTSTFPRWVDDTVPPFVYELSIRLARDYRVVVIAPHCAGSRVRETMQDMEVIRFRYAPPAWEGLAYGGGILANINAVPWKLALVPLFLLAQLFVLLRVLVKYPDAAIHAHWVIPQGMVAVLAAKIMRLCSQQVSVLCTLHGGDLHALKSGFMAGLRRWILDRTDRISVVSEAMRKALGDIGGDAKTRVISMGIDAKVRFVPPPVEQERIPHRILFAGRIVEKKGLEYLIKAMPKVLERHPDASLVVVGDGPILETERARAIGLGIAAHVEFLGAVPNSALPGYYASASVFVAPFLVDSRGDQEGLGLVVAEAQACGCPVVVSDLMAVHDLVEDGATGLLVKPGDVAGIAEAVCRIFVNADLCQTMTRRARAHVEQGYDWEVVADKYRALIFEL